MRARIIWILVLSSLLSFAIYDVVSWAVGSGPASFDYNAPELRIGALIGLATGVTSYQLIMRNWGVVRHEWRQFGTTFKVSINALYVVTASLVFTYLG